MLVPNNTTETDEVDEDGADNEEESWHFKVGNPACQETDWDGRRSRALLIAQADDRNDIIKLVHAM